MMITYTIPTFGIVTGAHRWEFSMLIGVIDLYALVKLHYNISNEITMSRMNNPHWKHEKLESIHLSIGTPPIAQEHQLAFGWIMFYIR